MIIYMVISRASQWLVDAKIIYVRTAAAFFGRWRRRPVLRVGNALPANRGRIHPQLLGFKRKEKKMRTNFVCKVFSSR